MKHLQLAICSEIAGVPKEIQVIPFGRHETGKGVFVLDEEGAARVMAAFASRKNDMVIDYEHQTLTGDEAPASGWIKRLINKGRDGIWAAVEWTPRAVEYLRNREYRYLSPVFLKTMKDERAVELLGAGLTNTPAIDGMVPLVNRAITPQSPLDPTGENGETQTQKEGMDMTFLEQLAKLLGLPPEASEEDILKAIGDLKSAPDSSKGTPDTSKDAPNTPKDVVANKTVLSALGLDERASLSEVTGTITAMKAGYDKAMSMATELASLKARQGVSEAEALVTQAMKDGKVTPAQKDWALGYATRDPEGFRVFAAKAPQVVIRGEMVTGGSRTGGWPGSVDEVQVSVNRALGVSDESFRKYGLKKLK